MESRSGTFRIATDSAFLHYGCAVVSVAVAIGLRLLLDPYLGDKIVFSTLFLAVMLTSWYGGFGPAAVATVIGGFASARFLLAPRGSFAIEGIESQTAIVLYLAGGFGIALLGGAMRRSQRRAEAHAQELLARRKEIENEMQERRRAEEQLRVTLASIGDAVISTDPAGRITFLNAVAEKLTGWAQQDARGRPLEAVFTILDEQTLRPVESQAPKALREGGVVGLGSRTVLVAKDGVQRPIEDSAAPIRDAAGDMIGVVLIFRDVTEQRQIERQIRQSEARKSAILETALDCIITMDHEGKIVEFNPAAERTFDYRRDEVIGKGLADLIIPPALRERHRIGLAHYLATGEGPVLNQRLELPALHADGSEFPVELTVTQMPTDGPPLFTAYLRNIAEHKRAEARHSLLDDISTAIVGSLDYRSILREIAGKSLPLLGDFCFFDLLTDDDKIERVVWKHVDPEIERVFVKARNAVPSPDSESHPVAKALRSGRPELVVEVSDDWLQAIAASSEYLEFLRALDICSMLAVPMLVGQRRLGALVFAYSDSCRRHAEDELRLAVEIARRLALMIENAKLFNQLRDADRKKNEFIAVLAHELRNPLAPITNALELMRLTGDPNQAEPLREIMERQVRQMVHLIDDLLDVSRITSGKIVLRKERFDIAEAVNSALEANRPFIEGARHDLAVRMPPEPLEVEGDRTRLAQVLSNLLANSAKYTPEGGRIWLNVSRDNHEAVIRVRDTGIGIPADMLPLIFEMFTQVDRNLGRSQGGLGIGLALVRKLVELHGGSVEAYSDGPGKGSEFAIRLPLASPQPTPQANGEHDVGREIKRQPPQRRILIVDDNKDSAETLGMLLEVMGNRVCFAYDGPSALETAVAFRPHVVLLDIGLPGMSGYDVGRRMRQMPELKGVVLVAQTGWGQEEDKRHSAEAGFNAHLIKPVDPADLRRLFDGLPTNDTNVAASAGDRDARGEAERP